MISSVNISENVSVYVWESFVLNNDVYTMKGEIKNLILSKM